MDVIIVQLVLSLNLFLLQRFDYAICILEKYIDSYARVYYSSPCQYFGYVIVTGRIGDMKIKIIVVGFF